MLPLPKMRLHVFDLCSDNHIDIQFVKYHQPVEAYIDCRLICILPIKSTISYVSALHEIGHILDTRSTSAVDCLSKEAYAWLWAEENAVVWNATAKRQRDTCLALYLKDEVVKPAKSSAFWSIYKK